MHPVTAREKIAARIRALRAKTVANGCTEDEALAAAAKVAELLEAYNMTMDEAELRASPFGTHTETGADHVGERVLWKVAAAVSVLTDTRWWRSKPGITPVEVSFFGFAHDVEVASYLLEICAVAMRGEQAKILRGSPRAVTPRQRNRLFPFIDGMADRLASRLFAMRPTPQVGTGLVLVRDELIEAAAADHGLGPGKGSAWNSRTGFDSYREGQAAADRVGLNPGVTGPEIVRGVLS